MRHRATFNVGVVLVIRPFGHALRTTPDLICPACSFNGDLSYARGFGTQWDVHFDQFSDLATKMPVMTVEGNVSNLHLNAIRIASIKQLSC